MVKLIAFYLPQYHRVPENDEWWGEGFTEWTNVKRAKPIFKNQTQPKVPLNNNYYDLMQKSTVEWQTGLMKKYGVYGFCYFHYWFTGKQLLEKPAQNLLKWKDIDQPFCFAWANVTWARTWTGVKEFTTNWVSDDQREDTANGDESEGKADSQQINKTGILVEQKYGGKKEWEEHYQYLKDFFLDPRYIKVDGKPVFLIYELNGIPQANEMFDLWNKLAKEDGLPGIHIVSMNQIPEDNPYVEAVARYGMYGKYDRRFSRRLYNKLIRTFRLPLKQVDPVFNYKKVWKNMVRENPVQNLTTYPGAVVTYDETPRKGKKAAYLSGASPEIFEKYLTAQIKKTKSVYHTDYIFIDAWNEWGEGNYLEPDEEHGYAYLEALKNSLDNGRSIK